MTFEDRNRYQRALGVLQKQFIDCQGPEIKLTCERISMLPVFVSAMERWQARTGVSLRRYIAMMNYHAANPSAVFLKDAVTMQVLEACERALRELLDEE